MGLQPSDGESYCGKAIAEIEVLWITAGLSCDGDTIAMTAATQPSIEGVVLGGDSDVWTGDPRVTPIHPVIAEQRAGMAAQAVRKLRGSEWNRLFF
jgi:hypothetical protein